MNELPRQKLREIISTYGRCSISRNALEAIKVYENGSTTVENCDLTENQAGSWSIADGSKVYRRGNKE